MISFSRSARIRKAADWTRPADFPPVACLTRKDVFQPQIRSRIRRAQKLSTMRSSISPAFSIAFLMAVFSDRGGGGAAVVHALRQLARDHPRDPRPLAVGVCHQVNLRRLFGFGVDGAEDFGFAGDDLQRRCEVVFDVHADAALLGKVHDVAHRGTDVVLRAEVFAVGGEFAGRLDDD
jgi:hypothetical protein